MYLAMNRFRVPEQNATAFEDLWLGRDSHLKQMPGFVSFHMLKGPLGDDGLRLYASHTEWADENAFRAWTQSEQFRAAHKSAGGQRRLFEGAPQFEGFTSIQHIATQDT